MDYPHTTRMNRTMKHGTLSVTADFSARPFGRYRTDGNRSAEVFREDFLIPRIAECDEVTVDLSGTNFYGSSFLEEVFGGLVRHGYSEDMLRTKLKIVHKRLPSIAQEAWMYIHEAQTGSSEASALTR